MMGRLVIMGSGELAPGLVATHRAGVEAAGADKVVLLDTPFGFQENVEQLTDRLVTFFATSLNLPSEVASLRNRRANDSERERFLAAIRRARYVFAGPGSPSYALDIWRDIGTAGALHSVRTDGGTVTFASAASLALGHTTIPVYEIYKVGAEPTWLEGLDLMADLGLPCSVVPHWNNAEGGNHDTSRCYIGERRLKTLENDLEVGILGVDEHTAAIIDLGRGDLCSRIFTTRHQETNHKEKHCRSHGTSVPLRMVIAPRRSRAAIDLITSIHKRRKCRKSQAKCKTCDPSDSPG